MRSVSCASSLLSGSLLGTVNSILPIANRLFSEASSSSIESSSGIPRHEGVIGACILERLPIVVRPPPDYETEFRKKVYEWSFRLHRPVPRPYSPVERKRADEEENEPSPAQVWSPAPTRTAADEAGDVRSLERCLDERLFLLVNRGSGAAGGAGAAAGAEEWGLPAAEHREGETIRQTAERALSDAAGPSLEAYFVGNSPAAHLPGRPAIFLHRAQYLSGSVAPGGAGGAVSDKAYVWVPQGELDRYLGGRPDLLAVLKGLLKN